MASTGREYVLGFRCLALTGAIPAYAQDNGAKKNAYSSAGDRLSQPPGTGRFLTFS